MGVANTKSTAVTNADTSQPHTQSPSYIEKGAVLVSVGTVEVAAADDNGSVYRLARVPSSARVHRIDIVSDAIAAGTVYDVGVYKTAQNAGGVVVDADLFAANLDLSAGNTVPVDITFAARDIADIEKRVWELLGLSADPHIEYDICLTGDTVGTGAGTISLRVEFVL